jgi:NADH dehydrogenase
MPTIKLKGILGSLGKKHGFGLVAERPVTGRFARFIKSGILWLYKYHNA